MLGFGCFALVKRCKISCEDHLWKDKMFQAVGWTPLSSTQLSWCVCFSFFFYLFIFLVMCARLSRPHSAFQSSLNSSIVSRRMVLLVQCGLMTLLLMVRCGMLQVVVAMHGWVQPVVPCSQYTYECRCLVVLVRECRLFNISCHSPLCSLSDRNLTVKYVSRGWSVSLSVMQLLHGQLWDQDLWAHCETVDFCTITFVISQFSQH